MVKSPETPKKFVPPETVKFTGWEGIRDPEGYLIGKKQVKLSYENPNVKRVVPRKTGFLKNTV